MGERVAFVSHNSARLLTAFFGVCGYGRVLVPINFRLSAEEVGYIVKHSGARVLYVDPEIDEQLAGVECEHRFRLGHDLDREVAELPAEVHPFYVGTQAHPEFTSRPTKAHPLFRAFIEAAVARSESKLLDLVAR